MKKEIKDFIVNSNLRLTPTYSLLKLAPSDGSKICDTIAGQFVEVEISDSKSTFLRRPISINYVDRENNEYHSSRGKAWKRILNQALCKGIDMYNSKYNAHLMTTPFTYALNKIMEQ